MWPGGFQQQEPHVFPLLKIVAAVPRSPSAHSGTHPTTSACVAYDGGQSGVEKGQRGRRKKKEHQGLYWVEGPVPECPLLIC